MSEELEQQVERIARAMCVAVGENPDKREPRLAPNFKKPERWTYEADLARKIIAAHIALATPCDPTADDRG